MLADLPRRAQSLRLPGSLRVVKRAAAFFSLQATSAKLRDVFGLVASS
ncbi:hypothetical protein VSR34_31755 [Paraburkholderia sp. JHI2823]